MRRKKKVVTFEEMARNAIRNPRGTLPQKVSRFRSLCQFLGYSLGLVAFCSALFFGFYGRQTMWRWFGHGFVSAEARVLSSSHLIADTEPPRVSYKFFVYGMPYTGRGYARKVEDSGIIYTIPSTIPIRYDSSNPSHNYTEDNSIVAIIIFFLTSFIFIACETGFFFELFWWGVVKGYKK